ncbi:MAG: hypothetical protein HOP15_11730 [Planctomycetes bacterium]|nr:hypothetical protein [Planctomycetota bacterium]
MRKRDETLEFLDEAGARALERLQHDLARWRRELSEDGAAGEFVRAHPLLALTGATAVGLGLGLAARATLRSTGRVVASLSSLAMPLGLSTSLSRGWRGRLSGLLRP